MKAKKNTMIVFATILSFVLILTACSNNDGGNDNAGNNGKGEENDKTEHYTFTFYSHYDWATTSPWDEDPVTSWIIDNLKVEAEPIQSGGAAEGKLNTMIAAEELPDMIQMDRGADVERLRAAGVLVPLDEYLDDYPNLVEQIGESTLNMLRSPDGKLYQIPNWYTTTPNGNSGWMVNNKIYEELGSPTLETYDDLYSYLTEVKAKYPDVVPLEIDANAFGFSIIYAGYREETPPDLLAHHAYADGDELKPVLEDPIFRQAMTFTNKLFRERLISQDVMTQTPDMLKEKLNTGRVAVFVGGDTANWGKDADIAIKKVDPDNGYTAIWPIHEAGLDKNKITPNGWVSLGWNVNVITKNAEQPERIIEYLDWVVSPEGQRVLVWGPPGMFWEEFDEDGHPILLESWAATTADEKSNMKLGSFNIAGNTSFVDPAKAKLEMTLPEEARSWSTVSQSKVFWKTSANMTEFVNLEPASDTPEGIASQSVKDIYTETFAKAIFAKDEAEVNSILDEGLSEMKDVGISKVLAYYTEVWNSNKEKLGSN